MPHTPVHLCLLLALLGSAPGLHAHHGAAAYDQARRVALTATVTAFDWRNPHALLHFVAPGPDGAPVEWTAETAGLVILQRAGWTRHSLEPGDRVTIDGFPARNGSATMILQRVVLPDGRELTNFVPR